ncbi:hypothetical protein ACGFYP_32325 [Streptomyces sp. NPDC048370]|uniref:hypothetical protein n=1 Tax=Streptomyces sp. NPDC048370 TaxID=3365540 RepID=UPI003712C191
MGRTSWKRAGVSLVAVAVVAGVAGCEGGGGGGGGKKAADAPAKPQLQTHAAVTKVIQAAYEKTSAAKSAKVKMTMTMPAGLEGGGTMEMTGVQGWDPAVMDITMKGSSFALADPEGPSEIRMIMLDGVMYMDGGAKAAAEMDGKRWMKLDFQAAAEMSGDKDFQKSMTGGLENMNQDPAKQIALMLDSPNLKHVGPEKVDGVEAQHYKGSLTLEQMVATNKSLDVLPEKDRKELIANIKKSGITGYDTELWVNGDGYPVKMDIGMKTPQGAVKIVAHYSDYGAKAAVQAPPAKDTVDLFEMLKGLGEGLGEGAGQA